MKMDVDVWLAHPYPFFAAHLLVDRRPGLGAEEPGYVAVVRFT